MDLQSGHEAPQLPVPSAEQMQQEGAVRAGATAAGYSDESHRQNPIQHYQQDEAEVAVAALSVHPDPTVSSHRTAEGRVPTGASYSAAMEDGEEPASEDKSSFTIHGSAEVATSVAKTDAMASFGAGAEESKQSEMDGSTGGLRSPQPLKAGAPDGSMSDGAPGDDDDDDDDAADMTAESKAKEAEEEEEEVIPDAKHVFITRDELAKTEQDTADLVFRVITNDGQEQTSVWLTGAKNIFSQQLPKMPPEYIARLVFDPRHRSMVALKHGRVVGGICYRPFFPQRFAEIAFLAITSSQQVRGYGTRLMNNLKEAVKNVGITEFLTYADNYATGYFRKQGFTDNISMDPRRWKGYIKEYEGGTLMQCSIHRNVHYNDVAGMLRAQRDFLLRAIRKQGINLKEAGVEIRDGRLMTRLGTLAELRAGALKAEADARAKAAADDAGTGSGAAMEDDDEDDDEDEDKTGTSSGGGAGKSGKRRRRSSVASSGSGVASRGPTRRQRDQASAALRATLSRLLDAVKAEEHSWPFREPVDREEAEDYYLKIKEPMDLQTMEAKVKEDKYGSIEGFLADVKLICQNCRQYNPPDSSFVQAANRLEAFVGAKHRVMMQQKQPGIIA